MKSVFSRTPLLVAPLLALCFAGFARAYWTQPTNWPVARLTENLERFLASHPDDVAALYSLGRIHAYAFAYESDLVALFEPFDAHEGERTDEDVVRLTKGLASARRHESIFSHPGGPPLEPPTPPAERRAHLTQAVRVLQRACELAPERAEIHLSLASALESGAPFAGEVDVAAFGWPSAAGEKDGTQRGTVSEHAWLERALASYRRAFELAREADGALEAQPVADPFEGGSALDSLVSHEAGEACLRLARERGVALEADFVATVETQLKALAAKPANAWITPILLSLDGCPELGDLVTPQHAVLFDLDGDGLDELWPWLAPGAGWLVWDPEHTGEITSGRQLFGDRSGWFFFRDGYRVLDALDDDHDGELKGAELAGIAVWFDRDADGVSDHGEAVSVEALGIVALAAHATERIGASLGNAGGVELADGRILPTYDWVLESLP